MSADRAKIDTEAHPLGKWCVMRHLPGMKKAKFSSLHETAESAMGEAERLAAKHIEEVGVTAVCYYVLMIKGRAGVIGNRLISESI